MTDVTNFSFQEVGLDAIGAAEGRVAILMAPDGKLSSAARRVNNLTRGALQRLIDSERFEKAKDAQVISMSWPSSMAAAAVDIDKLDKRPRSEHAVAAGATLATM